MKKKIIVKEPTEWWFDPKVDYKTFLKVVKKFPESGPTPVNSNRILWQGLRDRHFNIYIDSKCPEDPIIITRTTPKKDYITIKSPVKKSVKPLIEDVMQGKFGTKNRAELLLRLSELK